MRVSYYVLLFFFSIVGACNKPDAVLPKSPAQTDNEGAASVNQCPQGTSGEAVEGRYIVALKSEAENSVTIANIRDRKRYVRSRVNELMEKKKLAFSVTHVYYSAFEGFAGELSDSTAKALEQDPLIESVEKDYFISLGQSSDKSSSEINTQISPWGVRRVGKGTESENTAWILDTGIDLNHSDLNVDQQRSVSFVCSEPGLNDRHGHGTHIAGIIGAIDNDYGVVGIAPGNILVSVKVMDGNGDGTVSNVMEGLDYVYQYAQKGDVVNMSLSGGVSNALDQLVRKIATEKKIYFAIAAGNESQNACSLSPQRVSHANVFTVSAMDSTDSFASFSNFGVCVDFCAPGEKILSTYLEGKYAYLSGTSMASPHIAGLLLQKNGMTQDGVVKNDPDGKADPIMIVRRSEN